MSAAMSGCCLEIFNYILILPKITERKGEGFSNFIKRFAQDTQLMLFII